ncbi:hypothetical protein BDV10DRAFT_3865 [Aspergillus recurvatus]
MTLQLVFARLLMVSTPACLRSKNCESRVQFPGAALHRAAAVKISRMTYWADPLARDQELEFCPDEREGLTSPSSKSLTGAKNI